MTANDHGDAGRRAEALRALERAVSVARRRRRWRHGLAGGAIVAVAAAVAVLLVAG